MPEDQGKIPNKEKNLRASEQFNGEFRRHLTQIGWKDPELQKRFIALVNSYILSGKNSSSQRVIVNYLDKGLDVLNIELKRIEITKNDNVVQVNPDDVGDENEQNPEQQVETVTRREFNSIISEGKRKRLSPVKILKEELSEGRKRNQVIRKILDKTEGDYEELEEIIDEALDAILEQRVIKEQGEVNSNNFRVFFNNYLNDDKSWTSESAEKLISAILDIVEKGAGNITGQKQAVRETDELINRLSKVTDIKTAPQTKNSQIAFNELATFASKLRGWSSEFFSEFMDSILKIVGSSGSQKSQRFVVDKFTGIESSMKSKKDKKKDKDSNKDNQNQKNSNEKKDSKSGDEAKKDQNKEESGKDEKEDKKELKKELDYSYTPRDYKTPKEKMHIKLEDRYGVEIGKAYKKLKTMRNVDIQELPEAKEFDSFLTKLEAKFDDTLVEDIWTVVIDKPEPFGEWEFEEIILSFLVNNNQNEIQDVFKVVNLFYKYYKKAGVI